MKKVIKYQLEDGTTPNYILEGGQFYDGTNLIGVSIEDETQISESAEILDKASLLSYVDSISVIKSTRIDGVLTVEEMDSSEKEIAVNIFLESVGMSDLE